MARPVTATDIGVSTLSSWGIYRPERLWHSLPQVSFMRLGPDVAARDITLHLNLPPVGVAQVAPASLRSSPSKQRDVSTTRCDGPRTQFFASPFPCHMWGLGASAENPGET